MGAYTQHSKRSAFLQLPREIRDRIYELSELVPLRCELDICEPVGSLPWAAAYPPSPLFEVCSQVEAEVLELFQSRNHFRFWLGQHSWAGNQSMYGSLNSTFTEAQFKPSDLSSLSGIKQLYLNFYKGTGPGQIVASELAASANQVERITICPNRHSQYPTSAQFQSALLRFMRDILEHIPSVHTVRFAHPISEEIARRIADETPLQIEAICAGEIHEGCDRTLPLSPEPFCESSGSIAAWGSVPDDYTAFANIQGYIWNVRQSVERWHQHFVSRGDSV
ncbi:hypothetical protein BDP81DRAFT_501689 [Colletotrichum phormii]|uniref:Uncharacterized protein n=1 Tax=Colletotrichum phormii TaxID=359342 RepID=A0AAI9ZGH6_9PEZI|nr:uncharacterized protein BDP81DRAFT_501689 [Colletotrichum phormii]KAK1624154.1 hypothetical protein BDP81DRAFT_501689 [Colletotrichum phormii]